MPAVRSHFCDPPRQRAWVCWAGQMEARALVGCDSRWGGLSPTRLSYTVTGDPWKMCRVSVCDRVLSPRRVSPCSMAGRKEDLLTRIKLRAKSNSNGLFENSGFQIKNAHLRVNPGRVSGALCGVWCTRDLDDVQ